MGFFYRQIQSMTDGKSIEKYIRLHWIIYFEFENLISRLYFVLAAQKG